MTVEPLRPAADRQLLALAREPWGLPARGVPLLVRPSSVRDLPAVARMHGRCSPQSLLDRYRTGGRAPAVAAVDHALRQRGTVVAIAPSGEIVAVATLEDDPNHHHFCARVGVLVEDKWQRRGIGAELVTHAAGVAHACGYKELISYPGTATRVAQRLAIEVGRSRAVPDDEAHLHTYLPESAGLGLGFVRQRLAG